MYLNTNRNHSQLKPLQRRETTCSVSFITLLTRFKSLQSVLRWLIQFSKLQVYNSLTVINVAFILGFLQQISGFASILMFLFSIYISFGNTQFVTMATHAYENHSKIAYCFVQCSSCNIVCKISKQVTAQHNEIQRTVFEKLAFLMTYKTRLKHVQWRQMA